MYTARKINVPLNCSLIAADNCVFITADTRIEVNYAVKEFYKELLAWVNKLPKLPEPRTSAELAEDMKKFSTANHKEEEPMAVLNTLNEMLDELKKKKYNVYLYSYPDRYKLYISFDYSQYSYIESFIAIKYPSKLVSSFTHDDTNKCFIATLCVYNYSMKHELYEELKAWVDSLPENNK